jgi:hypothetical protein
MSLKHAILVPAVTASVGAAGIHFAVIGDHLQEYALFGYLFLILAWFQTLWPFAFFLQQSQLLAWLGIVVNVGAVAVWAISRTTGLPFGPDPWKPEAIGPLDVAASALELVLVVCVVLVVVPRSRAFVTEVRFPTTVGWFFTVLATALVIAITSAAFLWPVTKSAEAALIR